MKFKNPVFTWLLAIIFLSLQAFVLAQDNTHKDKNTQQKNEQQSKVQTDKDNNMLSTAEEKEQARYDFADKMAKNLMSKIDLSLEETEKIRDILIDYQEDVIDAKQRYVNENALTNRNDNTTDRNKDGVPDKDNTSITGDDNDVVGGNADANDKIEAYQDADRDANDKIEDALEEENIVQYNNVKKDWWAQIKNHVHSMKVEKFDNTTNRNDAINPTTGSGTK